MNLPAGAPVLTRTALNGDYTVPADNGQPGVRLRTLPLVTLHLTDRCNSRCASCDWWRSGRDDLDIKRVEAMLPALEARGTRLVLLSGGEPLLHRSWADVAALLRRHGLSIWLLTSGLSLAKHARRVAELFDAVTVSLDGTTPDMYAAVRGVDAFGVVCAGIRAVADAGLAPGLRVTVQRANAHALGDFVRLGRELGAREVSFLAADVSNPDAFGRESGFAADVAPRGDALVQLERAIERLEREYAWEFASGFIAEQPAKLRRIAQYYAAVDGRAPFPAVRCNAPEYSAVIGTDGRVSPCFFIRGPAAAHRDGPDLAPDVGLGLQEALDSPAMHALRAAIRAGQTPQCRTCVCPLWREPRSLENEAAAALLPAAAHGAAA